MSKWTQRATRVAAGLVFALGPGVGCGPELSSISKLDSLRILAVRKSTPYAAPGEVVDLEMLWEGAKPREVESFFGFWCVNPPGGLYSECFRGIPTIVPRFVLNEDHFSLRMPEDILREPGPGGGGIRFGTAFVFYGVCEGRLVSGDEPLLGGAAGMGGLGDGGGAPMGGMSPADRTDLPPDRLIGLPHCVDDEGSDVGSDRFVIGYSQIFAYDGYRNENPALLGFEWDGQPVQPDCLNSECIGRPAIDETPLAACKPGLPCLTACTDKPSSSCPAPRFGAVVDPTSAEQDQVALDGFNTDIEESIWVSYFLDEGSLTSELRLVNDATQGWNADHTTGVVAPGKPGPITLWAVVRDNRGGVSFGRVRGYVRAAAAQK